MNSKKIENDSNKRRSDCAWLGSETISQPAARGEISLEIARLAIAVSPIIVWIVILEFRKWLNDKIDNLAKFV